MPFIIIIIIIIMVCVHVYCGYVYACAVRELFIIAGQGKMVCKNANPPRAFGPLILTCTLGPPNVGLRL